MAIDPFSSRGTIWTIAQSVGKVFQWNDEGQKVRSRVAHDLVLRQLLRRQGIELHWSVRITS